MDRAELTLVYWPTNENLFYRYIPLNMANRVRTCILRENFIWMFCDNQKLGTFESLFLKGW